MAGRIPQSFIDEVLHRTDIVDLIGAHVRLKKSGKNYSACCPFHNEKTPSFTVNREKQFYHCFGCGASGNALSFLMQYERREFMDSLEYLAQKGGLTLPETSQDHKEERASRQPLYDMLDAAAKFYEEQLRQHPQRERATQYLRQRGLTGQVAKDWRLGYAPPGWDNLLRALGNSPEEVALLLQAGLIIFNEQRNSHYDAMRERVIFPIRDFRGRIMAFGGRVLDDSKPKYLNSPETPVFHKGEELYGLFETRQARQDLKRVVVVEGYMDVIAMHQAGLPFAVATLGTATSTTHVERLFRSVPDVIFCFDGDEAGRRAAWKALESALPALKDGVSAGFLFLPDGHDPDSLVREEGLDAFRKRLDEAEPLADFLFRHLSEGLRLDSLEGRSRLASHASPLLEKVPKSLFRQLLWKRLSEMTGLHVGAEESAPMPERKLPAASPSAFRKAPDDDDDEGYSRPMITQPVRAVYQSRPPQTPRGRHTLSLSDRAIQLLLQKPEAALTLNLERLEHHLPLEAALLLTVVRFLQQDAAPSGMALLGAWEGSLEGGRLKRIAEDTNFIPSLDVEGELTGIITQLAIHTLKEKLEETHSLGAIQQLKTQLRELEAELRELDNNRPG
ncbi:MAG: DNA primase [Fluviicoccus sp.]|uniref:DNA primase n=1 Tax=Fluviicoccus sp. TaxID=2003552 RepID=UPI0027165806|nr:DNA primase [Fluviicoccus sp.]MDO8329538.1 DNA primase [Fluviicoccus sp.]